ncbi:unnamed protein product [Fraxinus pennsylvanica]|uniref:CS domain-containing protein n=1 Tax=Fraxinus pennsylvanica TaxID=56036 RepID=A0AAD2AD78_9LAMI|nr:unnamed protein product [Fraxinus pennsylvanica]
MLLLWLCARAASSLYAKYTTSVDLALAARILIIHIVCGFKKNYLQVGLKGHPPVIDGELFQPIKVDDSFWSLEVQKFVSILLTKQNQIERWKCLSYLAWYMDLVHKSFRDGNCMLIQCQVEIADDMSYGKARRSDR